jgi:hypothetical protein
MPYFECKVNGLGIPGDGLQYYSLAFIVTHK